jgi:hypothetical protein
MAGYVPTVEEFERVRGQLMELAKDYLILYQMNGVQNIVDLYIDCSEKAKEALQSAKDLMAHVEHIEALAETDAEALGDEWQDVLDILEDYSFHHVDVESGVVHRVHESFKPLWVAAEALGLHTGGMGEAIANLRRGRPRGSSMYQSPESILEWLGPYVKTCKEGGRYPTRELVASYANVVVDTMMYHVKKHFSGWVVMLAALEDS